VSEPHPIKSVGSVALGADCFVAKMAHNDFYVRCCNSALNASSFSTCMCAPLSEHNYVERACASA
jgi:hypothetical protein